ncbi:glycosyltransferase family 2 protein [Hufsiella ginkgonis]|uniref:Glycosyltransferase n=1 Tax=Hufsiella ginkgonis TaxID=2695274 RepID=A0A7K1XSB4_9SPHI|nr:glycosyltransferase [Hufsiella ginkgonis]MXV13895.1 glycosyltransferase [Hufsiella ginkgonis]
MINYRISFCIVCMNRLNQLKETLLRNINNNSGYEELEFVVLNYNSQDGMHEWMIGNMQPYLANGKVSYYHTVEPQKFSHSHAKNMAFKLAKGEIVCNINADHYTGENFAKYVNDEFVKDKNIILTTVDYFKTRPDYHPAKDVYGKVCLRKNTFMQAGGFDETMTDYGFEDWDLVNRVEMAGNKRVFIDDPAYLEFIAHTDEERYTLKDGSALFGWFMHFITPSMSEFIRLYESGRFERGILIDRNTAASGDYRQAYQKPKHKFAHKLNGDRLLMGSWQNTGGDFFLLDDFGGSLSLSISDHGRRLNAAGSGHVFYRMADPQAEAGMAEFIYFYPNRCIMERNLRERIIVVNPHGFGQWEQLNVCGLV